MPSTPMVTLDGSHGEGGGQILRTGLTLALLTGRPFQMIKIRAHRDRPGLRPQHLTAVQAAARLGEAEVEGAAVGSSTLVFRPRPYTPRDLEIDIGTAGATALVLQTLHLPLALRADQPVRLTLVGGTFNTKAPSFPFLEATWRHYLALMGMPISLAMPSAGFYPRGGGRLEAWIEPATPRPLTLLDRGPLRGLRGVSMTAHLHRHDVAGRMLARAERRLAERGLAAEIRQAELSAPSPGAAISLTAEHAHCSATFVGLGARGKPAEVVADEAVDELLAYLDAAGAVDPHSADQILLPLALAEGRSAYTVAEVTEHLRTNAATIRAFLDRDIRIEEPTDDQPGRVLIA
ncbi:MAG: RNA 3'-terminal phosphate cyclase [Isosphaeraceae bacterium]|nr:RNA 3'-terminal phosphate cyclase [Isosphaeraceae bacterium]